ncbi:hypothetical protein [Nostoc sp.]|uniref:hypothetical protein n=1 Tax=Nostoc sp. TaxID=1180 RepID=UPI002FF01937
MERSPPYNTTEKLIPESQLEALVEKLVKKTLAEILGVNATNKPINQWYSTKKAYLMLGLESEEQLREKVRDGTLRVKVGDKKEHEVRDVRSPSSQIPRYQFHIEKCEARLSMPPEQRQPKKGKKIA